MTDVRADSDHRKTAVPITSDTLPGFGVAVGPAPPPAPALARASAPAACPGLVPAVSAQSSATERRGVDAFFLVSPWLHSSGLLFGCAHFRSHALIGSGLRQTASDCVAEVAGSPVSEQLSTPVTSGGGTLLTAPAWSAAIY